MEFSGQACSPEEEKRVFGVKSNRRNGDNYAKTNTARDKAYNNRNNNNNNNNTHSA